MEKKIEEVTTVTQQTAPGQVVRTTKVMAPPTIRTGPPQERYETKKAIFRTYQIIWYILGVVEALLIFRIILKALGANPLSGFAAMIYGLSSPLSSPFAGLFGNITSGTSVFEMGTFIGCVVYLVIAYALVQLFQLIKPTTPREVDENV